VGGRGGSSYEDAAPPTKQARTAIEIPWRFHGTLAPPPVPAVPESDSDSEGWVWIGGLQAAVTTDAAAAPVPLAGGHERGEPEAAAAEAASSLAEAPVGAETGGSHPTAAAATGLPPAMPSFAQSVAPSSSSGPADPVGEAEAGQATGDPTPVGPAEIAAAEPVGTVAASPAEQEQERAGLKRSEVSDPSVGGGAASAEAVAPGREPKVRRVAESEAFPQLAVAVGEMTCAFGGGWRGFFHYSHRLSRAHPIVYCRVCGRNCAEPRHIAGLALQCPGPPVAGSNYVTRLRRMEEGKHPLNKSVDLGRAVPLPPGSLR